MVLGLIQIGGLGLMTLTTFFLVLLGRRITLRGRLLVRETYGQATLAGLVRLTRAVILVTFLAEAAGAAILAGRFWSQMPPGRAVYFGIFHSVSAFCNAGFDLFGDSLVRYASDLVVVPTMGLLIVVGGLGFVVLKDAADTWRSKDKKLTLHSRTVLRVTAWLIGVGTLLILALEYNNPATLGRLPPVGKVLSAWFHAVTPRTAGFNTVATALLRQTTLLFTVVMMFVGASPGGTGGGIKTTTAWVVLRSVVATVRGRSHIEAGGRTVPREVADRALAIGAMSLGLVLSVTGLLLFTEKAGFLEVFFETTSAFGTVGLSMGLTTKLSTIGRIVIPMTMLAGRVGPLTMAVALALGRSPAGVHFPEERVIVG
ncbi:MAG: hypothetical protein A2Y96_02110 [Firmicutes bacterium RBG_13_65_8]|nr:MAG: hypothetical protein A2Y96_02110 [Firmicutes bacterium RBG_13_65_8]